MIQLATRGALIGPVPCAEVRSAEVRELYRQRFPHEWISVELAICLTLIETTERQLCPTP